MSYILLLDQDQVLANFLQLLLQRYNMAYDQKIKIEDIKHYNLTKTLNPKCLSIFRNPGFFKYLKPIEGAIETSQKLQEEGYGLLVVTAPENAISAKEKYEWIEKWMPFISKEQIIMTSRKDLIRGDLLFDDSPLHLANFEGFSVCMDQPYNQGNIGEFRVKNWTEFYELVHNILPM